MQYQQYIIDETRKAAEEAFRYAKSVPPEKVEWKPLEAGRSVLDQARELARCPVWSVDIINQGHPEWSEEIVAKEREEMERWSTVEECEQACFEALERMFELYRSIGDDRLSETRWLPYDGGRDFTMVEIMDYPRWNFNYHLGQIAYIQTLYGDSAMH
jgi:hypothetical protein